MTTPTVDSSTVNHVVRETLALSPIIDGHNDIAWESRIRGRMTVDGLHNQPELDTDIQRLRTGGVGAQFWSVFVEDTDNGSLAVQHTLEQIDWIKRFIAAYPDDLVAARSAADIEAAWQAGKIASLLGAEGAHQLANSPAVLRIYAELGVRYLTLTHNRTSDWADAAHGNQTHGGLTERGRAFIGELERLGMLVDLSHVAPSTMHATLDIATAPVIFSHSSARALYDHPRNVPDDVLRRIPANGGIVMVTFVPQFLSADFDTWFTGDRSRPRPPIDASTVADHIEHVREIAGLNHLGFGGDYDGTEYFPVSLEGVDGYPVVLAELARRGWSVTELAAITSGNILRILRDTDAAFAGERPAPRLIQ
ncbi:MAG: membrane dipeptidase [Candidatus Lumbricidophila eiseniae]|uniref:Membrane dipeptidase n=1 Tax=Candidatus Lumbricidiphila eiseniae TaxID=1969409 RepID=A0A2A6FQ48_9MICO|nr:MAG: membrane dipeptidase [Candidatus Lumbricidophila eiseniae]